jgi:hypothetical protein
MGNIQAKPKQTTKQQLESILQTYEEILFGDASLLTRSDPLPLSMIYNALTEYIILLSNLLQNELDLYTPDKIDDTTEYLRRIQAKQTRESKALRRTSSFQAREEILYNNLTAFFDTWNECKISSKRIFYAEGNAPSKALSCCRAKLFSYVELDFRTDKVKDCKKDIAYLNAFLFPVR